jgi:hypothetical protein
LVEFTIDEKRLFDTSILTGSVGASLKDEKILFYTDVFMITCNNSEVDIVSLKCFRNVWNIGVTK